MPRQPFGIDSGGSRRPSLYHGLSGPSGQRSAALLTFGGRLPPPIQRYKRAVWAGSRRQYRRLQIGPSAVIHRLKVEPMGAATDVQGGRISTGSSGGDGGRGEHPGGCAGVRVASGLGAQYAGAISPAGVSAAECAVAAQPLDKLGRSPIPASSARSWKGITAPPRSSAIRPSASMSGSGKSTAGVNYCRQGFCPWIDPIPDQPPNGPTAGENGRPHELADRTA